MRTSKHTANCLVCLFLIQLGQAVAADAFIFTAPPRGTAEQDTLIYEPVARYLTKVTGQRFVYRHPDNWITYQMGIQEDRYDLVFDSPHFIAWRMARYGHVPLVKLQGELVFVVTTSKDQDKISRLDHLGGHTVCGLAPPDLATLSLYREFDPVRQPLVIEAKSNISAYQAMLAGRCTAAILRDREYDKIANGNGKIVWRSEAVANLGFTSGRRVPEAVNIVIAKALLAPEASNSLAALLARYSEGMPLVRARSSDYQGLDTLLSGMWGFD